MELATLKKINIKKYIISDKDYLKKVASKSHCKNLFSEPGIYCVNDEPAIIYGQLSDYDEVLWALSTLPFKAEARTSSGGNMKRGRAALAGLGSSCTFGFRPRIPYSYSANFCGISSSALTHPPQHQALCNLGKKLCNIYRNAAPSTYSEHEDLVNKNVLPCWLMKETVFTSGIANKNNPLRYHYDKGNFENLLSCMAVFRKDCEGGELCIPELNSSWDLKNGSFFLFNGQKWLHGVAPIKSLTSKSYRYSVAYYSLKAMSVCGTIESEVSRSRSKRVTVERARK